MMENGTIVPVVSDCRSLTYEYEPLWILVMIVASAVSTIVAMVARAQRARQRTRAPPSPRGVYK